MLRAYPTLRAEDRATAWACFRVYGDGVEQQIQKKRKLHSMNERVVIDPEIQHGKPVIRGTRVPVARIVGGLAGGMTREEVMREYEISEQDVLAALSYKAGDEG